MLLILRFCGSEENTYIRIDLLDDSDIIMSRYFNFEPSFKLRWCRAREIRSSNPPVVTGICDPNKSRA